MELELGYTPRTQFVPFHQRSSRFGTMVCHRRAGKTVACIGELVIRAMYTKKKRAEFSYVGPFRAQAKKVAWAYLKDFTEGLRKGPPRESDLSVTFHNGATITIYGADNPDSLRGLFFDGIVLDEYGDMRPSIWGEIVLPTLLDRKGWAIFIGTPKGKNHFYHMVQRAKKEESWFEFTLKASESGLLDEEALAIARAEMSEDQYEQEMQCSFEAAVKGSYYSEMITKLEQVGRIGHFPFDPDEKVYVSADLGYTDSTAFWFWQITVDGPVLIDYEEYSGKTLEFYFELLDGKHYDYEKIYLPHDSKAKSLQTGRSTVEQFLDHGYPCMVVPKLSIQHGIDAARLLMPQCRIDKVKCYSGIEALRAYSRSWNEKLQQFSDKPRHDWASNGSDSFRYFALVTATGKTPLEVQEEIDMESPYEYCLEDLYEARKEGDWRSGILRI